MNKTTLGELLIDNKLASKNPEYKGLDCLYYGSDGNFYLKEAQVQQLLSKYQHTGTTKRSEV